MSQENVELLTPLFGEYLSRKIAYLMLPRLPKDLAQDVRLKGGQKEWIQNWVTWADSYTTLDNQPINLVK